MDVKRLQTYLAAKGESLPPLAIETGTCRGNSTRSLARGFSHVTTIELNSELHRLAKERLELDGIRNVHFVQGDSGQLLPGILRALSPSDPVFFYLDAHWSGDRTVNWKDAKWRGYGVDTSHLGVEGKMPTCEEQCPLLEEIRGISEYCLGRCYILIDDMKNIPEIGNGLKNKEFPGEDWSHLSRSEIRAVVASRLNWEEVIAHPEQWLLVLKEMRSKTL
jgi:hypothetical protein